MERSVNCYKKALGCQSHHPPQFKIINSYDMFTSQTIFWNYYNLTSPRCFSDYGLCNFYKGDTKFRVYCEPFWEFLKYKVEFAYFCHIIRHTGVSLKEDQVIAEKPLRLL